MRRKKPDNKTSDIKNIFLSLKSNPKGLSEKEATIRSRKYGLNEICKKKKIHPFIKFLSYFKNPLILILLVAAFISGLTGAFKNSIIITGMVFLSIGLNFYQEHKSNKAAEKIAKKLAVRTTVLRDGKKKEILTKYIVPGDVILLSAGNIVPADGVIFEADDFFVNESALTGESFPVEKIFGGKNKSGLVFSGTNVVSGYCQVLITATGAETEYGKIAKDISTPEEINAFESGIKDFGYLIVKVIIFIVVIIFLINGFLGKDLFSSFVFCIAVAVGVTPELLPMIMSVNMAKGAIKMAKKGVIVKRLNAIPDFGSMDILCTDKTGTLTEDHITLIRHMDVFGNECQTVLRFAYINGFLETGIKSILDKAILDFKDIDTKGITKAYEIPYDFMRKRSSIIFKEKKEITMVTKGAPEEVFKICSTYYNNKKNAKLTAAQLKKINALYEKLSSEGLRVLAVATKKAKSSAYTKADETEMTLNGFVAFYDPPKQSAKETIEFMRSHGVEIKILTGDSPLVTKKICEELGIPIKGILLGEDLDSDKMNDDVIAYKAQNANILARLSPSQKEKIISALRKKGFVVGYLGDGINDAPSLKSADVGISVDNAVDVAKETADIILMKKGLQELMEGVLEGRKTFGNTMKYLMMGLSSNFGNMFSMVAAALYLPFFPMLPGQILINNFLYDTSQLAIPSDKVDPEYLKKPKHWDMKFIKNFMIVFGPISSLFDILTFIMLFSVFHLQSTAFQTGWFIESLATQTLVIYIIRTRKIPFLESRPSKYLVGATLGVILIGFILTTGLFNKFFGFSCLPWPVIGSIAGLVFVYLIMVEIMKQIFYKIYDKKYQM
ncbi:MAG: magnesium-translocating P-type ATPase [Patescibacteria group bacterium]|jgi:Mg2+-importing ATPase